LLLATALIVTVWQLPYGQMLLYPLTLLATYAHELGHGLTALLCGERFQSLVLHADGSGSATWSGNPGRIAFALIAGGGLMGPTVAGVALLLLSASARNARRMLVVMSALVLISVVLWLRNPFGIAFMLAVAVVFGLAAKFLGDRGAFLFLHVVAVALCLSWFRDLSYMFSSRAVVDGRVMPSDTEQIANALWLPYWFWGALIAVISISLTALGIWFVSRKRTALV
jgi:Peptidase M50B-like